MKRDILNIDTEVHSTSIKEVTESLSAQIILMQYTDKKLHKSISLCLDQDVGYYLSKESDRRML